MECPPNTVSPICAEANRSGNTGLTGWSFFLRNVSEIGGERQQRVGWEMKISLVGASSSKVCLRSEVSDSNVGLNQTVHKVKMGKPYLDIRYPQKITRLDWTRSPTCPTYWPNLRLIDSFAIREDTHALVQPCLPG
jgi:hypothetical protein